MLDNLTVLGYPPNTVRQIDERTQMDISLPHLSRSTRRLAYAGLAAGVLTAIVVVIATQDTGWWQLAVFGLGPDVALLAGMGGGLAKGQLHPRAVPLYNALHR